MRDKEFGIVTMASAYRRQEQWGTDCRSDEGRRLRGAPTLSAASKKLSPTTDDAAQESIQKASSLKLKCQSHD
jgi:hypothetical protein